MRSRGVRLIFCVLALVAIGSAAVFINFSEQQIARSRGAERAFSTAVRDLISAISDLRMSQAAYVATGQDIAFWAPKAADAAQGVNDSVTLLRSSATTEAPGTALDAASGKAAEFTAIDRRARDSLEQGTPVTAGDIILSDGGETEMSLLRHIETARAAEQNAARLA